MSIEITENVPPPLHPGRPSKYPFRELLVGQSFFAQGARLRSLPITYWRGCTGFILLGRQVTEDGLNGVRVWRTA